MPSPDTDPDDNPLITRPMTDGGGSWEGTPSPLWTTAAEVRRRSDEALQALLGRSGAEGDAAAGR